MGIKNNDIEGAMHSCNQCSELEQEVARLKVQLEEMEKQAHHDVLTGLPNRRYFLEMLETRIIRCKRYGDITALLFLDVNGLKSVNDNYGHGAGDVVLARLAEILATNIRASDMVARIGGDEFAILLDNLDADEVDRKIAFLRERFGKANITHDGQDIKLGVSIGYCFVGPKDNVAELMVHADAAMYASKQAAD